MIYAVRMNSHGVMDTLSYGHAATVALRLFQLRTACAVQVGYDVAAVRHEDSKGWRDSVPLEIPDQAEEENRRTRSGPPGETGAH